MDDIDSIRKNYFNSGSGEDCSDGIKLLAEKHPLTENLCLSDLDIEGTLDISPLTNLTSLDLSLLFKSSFKINLILLILTFCP